MNLLECIHKIPIYKEIISSKPEGMSEYEWVQTIPPIDKALFVKNFPMNLMTDVLQKAIEENRVEYNSTSGTTSERMQIVRPFNWWEEEERRIAPYTRFFSENLDQPSYSRAVLTTPMCSNTVCYKENPSYEKRIIGKKLYLNTSSSPDSWNKDDIQRMTAEIDLFKPVHVHADPIYLAFYFSLIEKWKLPLPSWKPQFLTVSFEYAPKICMRFIRSFWDICTYSMYGLTELGYLFCECEYGRLHWCEPLTYLHFLPFESLPNIFNLAVTSCKNPYMPFVKYVTNDLFYINPSSSPCLCSHPSRISVDAIVGRKKDCTISDSGAFVTVADVDLAIADVQAPLLLYQLDFSVCNQISCLYMTTRGQKISCEEEDSLCGAIEKIYGQNRKIILRQVLAIKPASSGKFSLIKHG